MREQKVDPSLLKFVITREQLMNLRETGMSWAKIATCFGMSVKEVWLDGLRNVTLMKVFQRYRTLTELDELLKSIMAVTPRAGES